jgi:hypothetical protein
MSEEQTASIFRAEDRAVVFLRNVGICPQVYTTVTTQKTNIDIFMIVRTE